LPDSKRGEGLYTLQAATNTVSTAVVPLRLQLPKGVVARVRRIDYMAEWNNWNRTDDGLIVMCLDHRILGVPVLAAAANPMLNPFRWAWWGMNFQGGTNVSASLGFNVQSQHFDPGYDIPAGQTWLVDNSVGIAAVLGIQIFYERVSIGEEKKQQLSLLRAPRSTQDVLGV